MRPPLSSVMSRSAATLTRSSLLPPARQRGPPLPPVGPGGGGCGTGGGGDAGGRLPPGIGNGSGTGRGGGPALQRRQPVADVLASWPSRSRSHRPALRVSRINCFTAKMSVRLLVSLPSEMMTHRLLAVVSLLREAARPRRRRRTAPCRRAAGSARATSLIRRLSRVQPFDQLRRVVEPVEEHLVVRIDQLEEEAIERLARGVHLVAVHAAAGVEDDAEADRDALGVEMRHRLQLLVVEDAEVVLGQSRHEPAGLIGHRRVDVDQLDAGAELERLRVGLLRRRRALSQGGQAGRRAAARRGSTRGVSTSSWFDRGSPQLSVRLPWAWPKGRDGSLLPFVDVGDDAAVLAAEADAIARDRLGDRHRYHERRLVAGGERGHVEQRAAAREKRRPSRRTRTPSR